MKKKLIIVVTAVLLVASIAAGGTLAYFSTSATANNVVTLGNVEIELNDTYTQPERAMPGQTIDKIVSVKNTGKNSAYVRIHLEKRWNREIKPTFKEFQARNGLNPELIEIILLSNTRWHLGKDADGEEYYYYNAVLEPGSTTDDLFRQFRLSSEMDNEYAEAIGNIAVYAEAIQADNVVPTRSTPDGYINSWGDYYPHNG